METRHCSPQSDYRAALPRRWCKSCRVSWMGTEPVTCHQCGGTSIPFGTDPYPPDGKAAEWTPAEHAASAQANATLLAQMAEGHRPPHWAMMAKGAANRKPTREEIIRSGQRATRRTTAPAKGPQAAPAADPVSEGEQTTLAWEG